MRRFILTFIISLFAIQSVIDTGNSFAGFAGVIGGKVLAFGQAVPQYPNITIVAPVPTPVTTYAGSSAANTQLFNFFQQLISAMNSTTVPFNPTVVQQVFQANKIVVYDSTGTNISPYKP